MDETFKVGDQVYKVKGYSFEGEVRSVFTNRKGNTRVVVELVNVEGNGDGMLHIFSPKDLTKIKAASHIGETKLTLDNKKLKIRASQRERFIQLMKSLGYTAEFSSDRDGDYWNIKW